MSADDTKVCSKCGVEKALSEFYNERNNADGKSGTCKLCRGVRADLYRELYKDYVSRKVKEHYRDRKNWQSMKLYAARKRAKKNGLVFDLKNGDIPEPEVCPVFGTPLRYDTKVAQADDSASVDRTLSTFGYTKANVDTISWRANRLMNDGTLDEFEQIVAYLKKRRREIFE